MEIGAAVSCLKQGQRLARAGWNGKGMWLELVPSERCQIVVFDSATKSPLPWVGMRTVQGDFVPWLCSQTDLLATDWEIV
jgi:hypothetical protein